MNADAWKSYPNAPKVGHVICAAQGQPKTGTASFDLDGFLLILVASSGGLRAYVNACPHQYLPLDWRSDSVLSADGTLIRCSNHDAGFDACTGAGVDGLGQGCALDPVPVHLQAGQIVIG